jgi:hypothetical protein
VLSASQKMCLAVSSISLPLFSLPALLYLDQNIPSHQVALHGSMGDSFASPNDKWLDQACH